MSAESYEWLAGNVLAGFAQTRRPWWADAAEREGSATNLFPAEVPMEHVEKLISSWSPITAGLYDIDLENRTQTLYDADMNPVQAVLLNDIEVVPTHKLIKASDTMERMSVASADWAIHSYRDWLTGSVRECVGDEAQVSSAGLLRRRAQAWVQIERPETAVGPDGILFSPYVTLSTSLDGSMSTQLNENTQMIVCDNTLQIGRGQGLAYKHTKHSNAKLGDYRSVLSAIMRGESDFRAALEKQLSVKVDDNAFTRFLEAFVPIADDDIPAKKTRSERKRREITELYRNDDRVTRWKDTEFGVVQAVNTWQQHMSQLKNTTGFEMDDTNLRAMRNYALRLRGDKGDDLATVKVLESVL